MRPSEAYLDLMYEIQEWITWDEVMKRADLIRALTANIEARR